MAPWTLGIACALGPARAGATYSVAATDADADQVGGAVTSCVGVLDVSIAYGGVPGFGVVHAQAGIDPLLKGRGEAMRELALGTAPTSIIATITDPQFDAQAGLRQYGIVDLQGRAKGYTGASAQPYKEDRQGSTGAFTYSVQGNILTGVEVIDGAEAGFRSGGCDLAERLMRALEQGAADGGGDSRCTPRGVPSDSVFLEVDPAGQDAGEFLRLSLQNTGTQSPLPLLRTQFAAWRASHPCPLPASRPSAQGCHCSAVGSNGALATCLLALVTSRRRRP
jgi:uncharacterized Ntn-hydrolase superfamily protein